MTYVFSTSLIGVYWGKNIFHPAKKEEKMYLNDPDLSPLGI